MPNILPLTLDELTPEMRERMEASHERTGYYSNAQLTLARRPEVAKAVQNLQQSIGGSSTVPMQTMFMVAELTSKIAGCRHCQSHVAKNLSRQGVDANKIRAIWEYQTSDLFDDKERAALDLAFAAAQRPSMAGPEQFDRLREVGYVEAELVDLMAMISLFGFLTCWNDSVATETEAAPVEFATEVLGGMGWEPGKHAASKRLSR